MKTNKKLLMNNFNLQKNENSILVSPSQPSKYFNIPLEIINPEFLEFCNLTHNLSENNEKDISKLIGKLNCNDDYINEDKDKTSVNTCNSIGKTNFYLKINCTNMNVYDNENNILCKNFDNVYLLQKPDLINEQQNNVFENSHCVKTPDILMKTYCPQKGLKLSHENRPDLIKDTNIQSIVQSKELRTNIFDNKNNEILLELNEDANNIIGDFGKEVEREFGLLVKGYSSLGDTRKHNYEENAQFVLKHLSKMTDAALSTSQDKIDYSKISNAFEQRKNEILSIFDYQNKNSEKNKQIPSENLMKEVHTKKNNLNYTINNYKKPLYDERQLPPVGIDYKINQQYYTINEEKHFPRTSKRCTINKSTTAKSNRKILSNLRYCKANNNLYEKEDVEDLYAYQKYIGDKELISSNSRYAKKSSWAEYLRNSVNNHENNQISCLAPKTLDLFNAYKFEKEIDVNTLKKHYQMAQEIEKNRRSNREKICKRLAMGAVQMQNKIINNSHWSPEEQNLYFCELNYNDKIDDTSDAETNSSDSETCPKLSKSKKLGKHEVHKQKKIHKSEINNDEKTDFFTKQAKLQIETRAALCQAKKIANMQMTIEQQKQRMSPITEIIRNSLDEIGGSMSSDTRRLSRQMLTQMNNVQLNGLLHRLHIYTEKMNESLMHILMERDEHSLEQDLKLCDIKELMQFIGSTEFYIQ